MRVLVTNDDGIHARGLEELAAALDEDGHDVVVVAPIDDCSGNGAAIVEWLGAVGAVDRPIVLNVNVPNLALRWLRGVRIGTVASGGITQAGFVSAAGGHLQVEMTSPGAAAVDCRRQGGAGRPGQGRGALRGAGRRGHVHRARPSSPHQR